MKSKYYFRFIELIRTDSNRKNCPSTIEQVANLVRLATVLQHLRVACGFPIIVNSAFRTPEVNSFVGGVVNSKHLDGLAADITCDSENFAHLCRACKLLRDDRHLSELKISSNYIHLAI